MSLLESIRKSNNCNTIKLLKNYDCKYINDYINKKYHTLLSYAIVHSTRRKPQCHVIETLLHMGATVNGKCYKKRQYIPFRLACVRKNGLIIKLLLAHGADYTSLFKYRRICVCADLEKNPKKPQTHRPKNMCMSKTTWNPIAQEK